jgi:hypothetical protein
MAVIARRGWSAVLAEVLKRTGNLNATGFSSRVEYFIWSAYLKLTLTYHHFELDTSQDLSFAAGDTSKALAADTYIILGASLLSGTTFLRNLAPIHAPAMLTDLTLAQAARPSKYARYGANLVIDCPADQAYAVRVFYYQTPAAPDFATTNLPAFASDCDEHLIEQAVRMVMPAVGRPDLGDINRQLLSEWLAEQPRDPILAQPQVGRERASTNRMIGGAQG